MFAQLDAGMAEQEGHSVLHSGALGCYLISNLEWNNNSEQG